MNKSAILLSLVCMLLVLGISGSCATRMEMPAMKESARPGPLRLEIGYALGNMRVDLFRQTKTNTSFVDGKVITSTENVAWHPLVARLGNGIIIDANFNICLDLIEVLGLSGAENYTISGKSKFLAWDVKDTQQKTGPKTVFKREGFISTGAQAVDSGDSIEITDTIFPNKGREFIRKHPDSIDYLPPGIFPDLLKSTIRKEDKRVMVPGFLFNSAIEQTDESTIRVNTYLDIISDGSRIAIKFHNLFGESTAWLDFYKNGLTYTRDKQVMAIEFDAVHCAVVWPYARFDLDLARD